jgi:hypothetical protein
LAAALRARARGTPSLCRRSEWSSRRSGEARVQYCLNLTI